MSMTSIKVPVELRDRLAEVASREGTTLAGAIERSLDKVDDAAFWEDVKATMGDVEGVVRDTEQFTGSLADGLEPAEDWSDVL